MAEASAPGRAQGKVNSRGIVKTHTAKLRTWIGVAAAAGLIAAAAAGAAWYFTSGRSQTAGQVDLGALPSGIRRDALNIVVITLDTTRADHIGAYGSTLVKTPALDRLAGEGTRFAQAMSSAPLTLPAHSSMFTGRFPPEHGVRDNGGFFLKPEQTTLAEMLKEKGFATGGFIAAFVLDAKWGMDQGFEEYFDDFDISERRGRSLGNIQRPGNEVVDKALPWIDSVKDRRFFAWIHLYDPHTPYDPPEPQKSEYKGHPYRGEVAFTDAQVGRVIGFLEERGLLDKTVVAVLGDHGESLGDHGEDSHGFFIYEAVTHVPFIMRAPFEKTGPRVVEDPVRIIDLTPTVLDLAGIPVPAGMSGRSLVPLMTGATVELGLEGYAEAMYPLHHFGWSDLRALRSGRYKLIDAPKPELFDIESDPKETTNIFDARRTVGDGMVARLREIEAAFDKAPTAAPAEDVDPEVRQRLAALGYVGSFVATANDPKSDRADPKDKIDLFNLMGTARDLGREEGGFDRAVGMLTQVVKADPKVIDAWFSLGNLYFKEGRYRESIAHFRKTLELKPDYDIAVINMAHAFRRLGDDAAAMAGYERYLQLDPRDAYVRYQVGEVFLDRGDIDRAEQVFKQALELDPKVASATNALGVIAYRRGDPVAAEKLIREAIAVKEDVRLARYNLALLAEGRGDLLGAEREYLQELKLHPDSYMAAFNLSLLYERTGQRDLRVDALKQSIDGNPAFAEGHIFLAKAYLDRNANLDEAAALARKGLSLSPKPEVAPLGHYVLADIYNRQGRAADASREVAQGRALEARVARGSR
jgi:arylsulfatase A-like enzyme/tetratricopeptide (TPR) repeat protein